MPFMSSNKRRASAAVSASATAMVMASPAVDARSAAPVATPAGTLSLNLGPVPKTPSTYMSDASPFSGAGPVPTHPSFSTALQGSPYGGAAASSTSTPTKNKKKRRDSGV
ncbi:uncharacterized protein PG998_002776 [Apiospora kogelbergensis]|uniref:uncharacterized protein n=1 Tax=Apiospora kogelbergensis TaxID=1337665 RepID=UPI00313268EB